MIAAGAPTRSISQYRAELVVSSFISGKIYLYICERHSSHRDSPSLYDPRQTNGLRGHCLSYAGLTARNETASSCTKVTGTAAELPL